MTDNLLYRSLKRTADCAIALLVIIVTLPLQMVVGIAVLACHGRPVLFRQQRPGRNGVVFELVKFRTMRPPDVDHDTDATRLTPLGRILRSTSLDELPTLWNVVRGDMSLVGPRPLLVEYLTRYSPTQARRHEVRPGITGLAQVRGRNNISWSEKLALDVEYVNSRSLGLDAKILWETVAVVLRQSGISADGHATSSEFHGNEPPHEPGAQ